MRIIVVNDENTEVADVTTAVQITYDALHASMDYGSGFLDTEELAAMCILAQEAGFEEWQDVVATHWHAWKMKDWHTADREARWRRQQGGKVDLPPYPDYDKHATDEEKRRILAEFRATLEEAGEA
jgi:hypothetical protein